MDFGTATSSQATQSFDSYLDSADENGGIVSASASAADAADMFTALTLPQTVTRTFAIVASHAPRLVAQTTVACLPSLLLALVTAWQHEHHHARPVQYVSELPFDEIIQDLPLVLWHLLLLAVATVTTACLVVRTVAESAYARWPTNRQTDIPTSLRLAASQATTIAASGLAVLVSLTAVYLVGHFLAVGLLDLRRSATATLAAHPDETILKVIAWSTLFMTLAVAATAAFGVAWLVTVYAPVVPVVLWQAPQAGPTMSWSELLLEHTGTALLEVFRQSYVLARDSHSYIGASLAAGAGLVTVVAAALTSWPLYAATHTRAVDLVAWVGGTPAGVWALYLPAMLALPVACVQQTVLYVTLRVVKEDYNWQALQGDLQRSRPEYAQISAHDDQDDDDVNIVEAPPQGPLEAPSDDRGVELQEMGAKTEMPKRPPPATE